MTIIKCHRVELACHAYSYIQLFTGEHTGRKRKRRRNNRFSAHRRDRFDREIPVGALKDLTTILKCNKHRLIHTSFILPFSEQEYSSLQERFGKYCVIISGKELESKILNYCKTNEYDYIFDKVEYCNQNRINRIEAFRTGSKERFLYKNSDLEYQREYRLVIAIEIPDDHFIRIGKLTSAACIESEKLKDLIFTVNYKSVLNSNE